MIGLYIRMDIEYKKIIRQIMGKEAKKRGFKMSSLKPGISKWPIASFNRNYDGHSQTYEITLELYNPGEAVLNCYRTEIKRTFDDEESFKKAIEEFSQYMNETGFRILDEETDKEPGFRLRDNKRILENYQEMALILQNLFLKRFILLLGKLIVLKGKNG